MFELTHFYVRFRPALSYLWDIEHFCSGKIDHLCIYIFLVVSLMKQLLFSNIIQLQYR